MMDQRKPSNKAKIVIFSALTLISCAVNIFFLETLINTHKRSNHLITFTGFLVLSIDGIIFTSRGFTRPPSIPIKYSIMTVLIYFVSSLASNWVFRFHIPMTLYTIFKSGSLMTSMLLGKILLQRSYSYSKILSVMLVTIGVMICTYASTNEEDKLDDYKLDEFIIGLLILSGTLFLASYLGVLQERIAQIFGKHPRESLFYNHILPLPFFAFLYKDIAEQAAEFSQSECLTIPVIEQCLPRSWALLLLNVFFQYICINSVFQLTSECTSLTVTLVITVRKFLSLLVSIYYFGNVFTSLHWFGALLVFTGSILFTDLHMILIATSQRKGRRNRIPRKKPIKEKLS